MVNAPRYQRHTGATSRAVPQRPTPYPVWLVKERRHLNLSHDAEFIASHRLPSLSKTGLHQHFSGLAYSFVTDSFAGCARRQGVAASQVVKISTQTHTSLSGEGGIAEYNRKAFFAGVPRNQGWQQDGDPLDRLFCRGNARHDHGWHCHSPDKIFARRDLYRGRCATHAALMRVPAQAQIDVTGHQYLQGFIDYDDRRQKGKTTQQIIERARKTARRLLFEPIPLDVKFIADIVKSDDCEARLKSLVRERIPGLDVELLCSERSPTDPPPAALLATALCAVQPSLDVADQFTEKGRRAGHASPRLLGQRPGVLPEAQDVTVLCHRGTHALQLSGSSKR